jgi:IclR family transcriptional regulator, KDG regulon repressor
VTDPSTRDRCGRGLRLFEYGQLALDRLNLFEVSVPILAGLRDRVRDLVQLGVPVGAEVLFLDRFEAQNLDPRFHGPAWRVAHSSSSGRAIAAFNPELARAIFDAGLIRRTRYTVVDPRRLTGILAEVRRRGYAATDEELEEGISSVAAPVRLGERAVAAVSVVGPSHRLHRDGIASIAAHAQDAARRIGEALAAG